MPKTREYQALWEACTQEDCPLCRVVQSHVLRYLDSWKYELFTDVDVRKELRRTQGFCYQHTWQLARMGATLPLAQAYRDILTDTIEQLQRNTEFASSGGGAGRWKRLFDPKNGKSDRVEDECPACQLQEQVTERHIQTLREAFLSDEFTIHFTSSDGLCLEHFRLTCTLPASESGKTVRWQTSLREAQLTCLQRMNEQLGELIRKHDYRFKNEARGPEMLAWKRVAGFVAGKEIKE